jgi:hypothetical protein
VLGLWELVELISREWEISALVGHRYHPTCVIPPKEGMFEMLKAQILMIFSEGTLSCLKMDGGR